MEHKAVTSSNVESLAYDHANRQMQLRFKGGGLYEYDDVPAEVYAKLLNAPSVGSHFAAHIKPYFRGRKIG